MEFPRVHIPNVKFLDAKGEGFNITQTPPQNIVCKLFSRELWGGRRVGTQKHLERSMNQSIFPNFSVIELNVKTLKVPINGGKFTPDGKKMIAVRNENCTDDSDSGALQRINKLLVFSFAGADSSTHLFMNNDRVRSNFNGRDVTDEDRGRMSLTFQEKILTDHITEEDNDAQTFNIRDQIFETFFKLISTTSLNPPNNQVLRFSSILFTEDSKFLIIFSSSTESFANNHVVLNQIRGNNESLTNDGKTLKNYTIHLVDINFGIQLDKYDLSLDRIYYSDKGVSLLNMTLAVLSVQHQTIYLFNLKNQALELINSIGRFCDINDRLLLLKTLRAEGEPDKPSSDTNVNALKQRVLAHVHSRASQRFQNGEGSNEILRFYSYFKRLMDQRLYRMQLVDEDLLLLLYMNSEAVLNQIPANGEIGTYVFYDMRNANVVGVFESISDLSVMMVLSFHDQLRNSIQSERYTSSPGNNRHSARAQLFNKQIHVGSQSGISALDKLKRMIIHILPLGAQVYSPSPYRDHELYSFDEVLIPSFITLVKGTTHTVRFYGRNSGLYKFRLQQSKFSETTPSTSLQTYWCFHPTEPFIVSFQNGPRMCRVNLHFRLDPGSVQSMEEKEGKC